MLWLWPVVDEFLCLCPGIFREYIKTGSLEVALVLYGAPFDWWWCTLLVIHCSIGAVDLPWLRKLRRLKKGLAQCNGANGYGRRGEVPFVEQLGR